MKKLDINFYLPKAITDEEIDLVKTYGNLYDNNGWCYDDCKRYHLVHLLGSNATGYGDNRVCKTLKTSDGKPIVSLSFEEFAVMTGHKQPKVEIKQESSNTSTNGLTIENIEKVLLKYIGEQESDDIINELKQLNI
jgi:hypothetical protein